jgi:hypothetical protein
VGFLVIPIDMGILPNKRYVVKFTEYRKCDIFLEMPSACSNRVKIYASECQFISSLFLICILSPEKLQLNKGES